MAPFAIYSLPDSRVKCLSPLVGVPVIAHQQRLTFSCSSPFRCSHLTPSSSLFFIHSPCIQSESTISSFVLNMHTLFIYSFLLATRQVSSSQCSASAISNYPLRESEKKGRDYQGIVMQLSILFFSFPYYMKLGHLKEKNQLMMVWGRRKAFPIAHFSSNIHLACASATLYGSFSFQNMYIVVYVCYVRTPFFGFCFCFCFGLSGFLFI